MDFAKILPVNFMINSDDFIYKNAGFATKNVPFLPQWLILSNPQLNNHSRSMPNDSKWRQMDGGGKWCEKML